jgi:hypothetical protein
MPMPRQIPRVEVLILKKYFCRKEWREKSGIFKLKLQLFHRTQNRIVV